MGQRPIILAIAALALLAGCSGSNQSVRAIAAAKKTNDLFDIFPSRIGSKVCSIPHGGPATVAKRPLRGVCSTAVSRTKAVVVFEERWTDFSSHVSATSKLRFEHAWRVAVTEKGAQIIDSIGAPPPQLWS
jgi:hypothetical protein